MNTFEYTDLSSVLTIESYMQQLHFLPRKQNMRYFSIDKITGVTNLFKYSVFLCNVNDN